MRNKTDLPDVIPNVWPEKENKTRVSKLGKYLIGILVSLSAAISPVWAGKGIRVTCVYDFIIDNKDAGNITFVRMQKTDGALVFKFDSEIKVAGWWGSWHVKASGNAVVDKKSLVNFDHKITEDGKIWRISGERHQNDLWCSVREVLSEKEREDSAVVNLAVSVAASAIPYAGTAMAVINLLGDGQKSQGDLRIPMDLFETTATELSSFLLKNINDLEADSLKKGTFRILDTTELVIRPGVFSRTGMEIIVASKQQFSCQTFSASFENEKSIYWIAQDNLGGFTVKEKGKDKDGAYEFCSIPIG